MHVFLLSIGVIATAVGMFTIGFGIPINEFSFGNALIISGTVAVAGGLVLIGIAAAVRELRRIADAAGARAAMRVTRPESEPLASGTARGGAIAAAPRAHLMQKPNSEFPAREPRTSDSRASEPRLTAVYSNEAPLEESPVARPRPNIFPVVRAVADAGVVDELEAAPLSPQGPVRAPATGRGERVEGKAATHSTTKIGASAAPAARGAVLEAEPRIAPVIVAERLVDKPQRGNLFDTVWPGKSSETAAHEVGARALKAESGSPRERIEPVLAGDKREDAATAVLAAQEARPAPILKSGVIDGMAYTLYTDGSIEAQLSQGTMRFGSIDALREHLESNP
jgi:hypothetical protein